MSFGEGVVTLTAGERIVIFSDGVSEALDAAGEEFGDDRLLEALRTSIGATDVDVPIDIRDAKHAFHIRLEAEPTQAIFDPGRVLLATRKPAIAANHYGPGEGGLVIRF